MDKIILPPYIFWILKNHLRLLREGHDPEYTDQQIKIIMDFLATTTYDREEYD